MKWEYRARVCETRAARTHKLIPSARNKGSQRNRVQSAIFTTKPKPKPGMMHDWLAGVQAVSTFLLTPTLTLTLAQTRAFISMKKAKNTADQQKGFTEKIYMGKVHINFIMKYGWMHFCISENSTHNIISIISACTQVRIRNRSHTIASNVQ